MRRPSSTCAVSLIVDCSLALLWAGPGCGPAASGDGDGDGIPDAADNCSAVANTDQADTNSDGVGDACQNGQSGQGGQTAQDETVSNETAVLIEADAVAAESSASSLVQMLDSGSTASSAAQTLAADLAADPNVSEVMVGEDGYAVSVNYTSGLRHIFVIVDEEDEDDALDGSGSSSASGRFLQQLPPSMPTGSAGSAASREAFQTGAFYYDMPAGKKALVANSLTVSQPLQDTSQQIERMLTARGYEVTRTDLTLDIFKRLPEFSVIYIEAHGKVDPLSFVAPCTDIKGNTMVLASTTPWTTGDGGNLRTYMPDVVCGRLRTGSLILRRPGQPAVLANALWVAPDYVRKYATGRFPTYTLMCLSACRGYMNANLDSEWKALLDERCDAGFFVGWTYRVHYALSARAYLNMFQMMTAGDETFSLTSAKSGKTYILLEKPAPPLPISDLASAWQALSAPTPRWDVDPFTGAQLTWSWPTRGADGGAIPYPLILAPGMRLFVFQPQEAKNLTTEATVVGMCRDNATLHVGGITVDMGAQRMGFFFPKIPVGASGEMYLEQNGRKGPTRNLMRWQPVFKVTGAGDNGLSYQITFRLQARAIAQSFPERLASFAWGSSTPYFSAAIDPQASVVTWSASGEATVDNFRYVHSGGSTANLSPVTDTFSSDDGATATIGVISDVPLEYTTTTTNLDDQSVSTSTGYLTSGFTVESLTLQNNWTGAGGSQEYGGGSDTMTWSAFSPSPLFDPNTTRR